MRLNHKILALVVLSGLAVSCKKVSTEPDNGGSNTFNPVGGGGWFNPGNGTSTGGSSTGGSTSGGSTSGGSTGGSSSGGNTSGGSTGGSTSGGSSGGSTTGGSSSGGSSGGGSTANCTGDLGVICKGGYGADSNKKEIPAKVLYLNPTGSTLVTDPAGEAKKIIDKANSQLVHEGHRLVKFSDPVIEDGVAPSMSSIMNSNYMISNYGSTSHYVLILVKDMVKQTGGTIGYSPGLRIDWKTKRAIVVMDADFVIKDSKGVQVIIHELFHGMGAPHTTDANGGRDNQLPNGLLVFKNIGLIDKTMGYDFQIYIEDRMSFQGVAQSGGFNWDTRTLMMWFATSNNLFLNSDSALNGAYTNILNVYYNSFVK